jgi:hypothetical protein
MAYLQFFPETFIQLNQEISQYHPELVTRLQNHPQAEFEILFAEICSYCNVAIDGTFDEEGLKAIAGMLLERLQRSRMTIIL